MSLGQYCGRQRVLDLAGDSSGGFVWQGMPYIPGTS
jgi:hypothetical protein